MFSTNSLAPDQRFDHWREERAKLVFGATLELPRERRRSFNGSYSASAIGDAIASELQASAYVVRRTESDIARVAGDSLVVFHQIRGPGLLNASGDHVGRVLNGDLAVAHSDLPYSAVPETENDCHCRMLTIPLSEELALGQHTHDLFAAKLMDGSRFMRPLRALFNALTSGEGRLADPARDVTHIARLALAARGRLAPGMPEVRAALRSALLQAALQIMEREKNQPNLSPAMVAAALGVSRRQLYVLFEASELSFARALASFRIEEARRLLLAHPDWSVTQTAFACGFDSLATFYRIFGSTYGMAPTELRLLEQGRHAPASTHSAMA
ncbi:helix-turn-helix transcriptional regulator [Devosia sp.]|uniref:helix-turn-helix transcriptional regulator n=1 Tax=Devosia sp. TaxID=1871048 RepID=UPI002FCB0275